MTDPLTQIIADLFAGQDLTAALAPAPPPRQHDRYSLLTTDMLTGRIVDEIVGAGNVTFGKQLNDTSAGGCRFQFDDRTAETLRAATLPGRTALYILEENQIVWGGPIWTRRADLTTNTVDLGCGDFFSYLHRLILHINDALNVQFVGWDDNDIVRMWLALTNLVGLTPDPTLAGNVTDQTVWNYEYANVGQLIQNLAATIGGPDVYCDVIGDPDTAQRVVRLGTPRLGRAVGESDLLFDNSTMPASTFEEDASDTTVEQWTPGAGSEVDQLFAHAMSARLVAENFPPLQAVSQTYDKVSVQDTLDAHAMADLSVHAGVATSFGSAQLSGVRPSQILPGDEARVQYRSPWLPDGGIDWLTRVTGFTVQVPDDGGDELITPTFGELVLT